MIIDLVDPPNASFGTGFLKNRDALTILCVEDDRIGMAFLEEQISSLGHRTVQAWNGDEALKFLKSGARSVDVVLMDREMPVMDGITAIRRMKDDPALRKIPVVMVTAADTPEQIREGLESGIFYYLTKPVNNVVLRSVLCAAARESQQKKILMRELKQHRACFTLIDTCRFNFRTIADAECLAGFMAQCFPDPDRVLHGLGELLINAVEHGNLGLGYAAKGQLIENGLWRVEVDRRQQMEEYASKTATAVITRKEDGIYVVITDQGHGFDWKRYMTIDPGRAGDNHGRGIAQARAVSFDKLTYNEKGNQAVAFASLESRMEW